MVSEKTNLDNELFTTCTCGSSSCDCSDDLPSNASFEDWFGEVYDALLSSDIPGHARDAQAFYHCSRNKASYRTIYKYPIADESAQSVMVCSANPQHEAKVIRETCHLRICPYCARREVARLLARYMPLIGELAGRSGSWRLRKITLTTPVNLFDDDASEQIQRYFDLIPKLFDRLLSKSGKDWRKKGGALASVEFGEDGLKMHFHIVAYMPYIPQKTLSAAWKELTEGVSSVVWIGLISKASPIDDAAETLKYATKFFKVDETTGEAKFLSPNVMVRLLDVLRGLRRVRSWGRFYALPKVEHVSTCPDCGAPLEKWHVGDWNIFVETGWSPDEQRDYLSSYTGNNFLYQRGEIREKSPPTSVQELLL